MGHRMQRHLTAHDVHRSAADKASAQNHGMHAAALYLTCYNQSLVDIHSAFEAIPHVCFNQHCHIVAGRFHNLR